MAQYCQDDGGMTDWSFQYQNARLLGGNEPRWLVIDKFRSLYMAHRIPNSFEVCSVDNTILSPCLEYEIMVFQWVRRVGAYLASAGMRTRAMRKISVWGAKVKSSGKNQTEFKKGGA